ncbi:organic cation transporter protein-like [Ptychodera flava]|uniref:organic cation transporter protein-like n=1 Tax=Ptychodera flava TaxID=63121 RepID=UPI00396A4857
MLQFDDVLKHILGKFGKYQKVLYVLMGLISIPFSNHSIGPVFLVASTDVWGKVPDAAEVSAQICLANFTDNCAQMVKNLTIPSKHNVGCGTELYFDQCYRYNISYKEIIYSIENGKPSLSTCKLHEDKVRPWMEYDTSQYKSTVSQQFDLVCDREFLNAMATSFSMAGLLIGSFVYGYLLDKIGRKKGFLIGVAEHLIKSNFSDETLAFIRLIPESPRWLFSVGRKEEAERIIRKCARINNVPVPDDIFGDSWNQMKMGETKKMDTIKNKKEEETMLDLFQLPKIEKEDTHIVLQLVNILKDDNLTLVNTLVYFGLAFNTSNLGGNDYFNCFLAGAVEIPAYALGLFIMDNKRMGRRWSMFYTMVIGGITCIAAAFVPPCECLQPSKTYIHIEKCAPLIRK